MSLSDADMHDNDPCITHETLNEVWSCRTPKMMVFLVNFGLLYINKLGPKRQVLV